MIEKCCVIPIGLNNPTTNKLRIFHHLRTCHQTLCPCQCYCINVNEKNASSHFQGVDLSLTSLIWEGERYRLHQEWMEREVILPE